eukprot:6197490-Alexandrium_andersonii.AAC.1
MFRGSPAGRRAYPPIARRVSQRDPIASSQRHPWVDTTVSSNNSLAELGGGVALHMEEAAT